MSALTGGDRNRLRGGGTPWRACQYQSRTTARARSEPDRMQPNALVPFGFRVSDCSTLPWKRSPVRVLGGGLDFAIPRQDADKSEVAAKPERNGRKKRSSGGCNDGSQDRNRTANGQPYSGPSTISPGKSRCRHLALRPGWPQRSPGVQSPPEELSTSDPGVSRHTRKRRKLRKKTHSTVTHARRKSSASIPACLNIARSVPSGMSPG